MTNHWELQTERVAVLAPSPIVTVTVENAGGDGPEIHFHAGGQGFWVARMAARLGARVVLCAAIGGESGRVTTPLRPAWPVQADGWRTDRYSQVHRPSIRGDAQRGPSAERGQFAQRCGRGQPRRTAARHYDRLGQRPL